MTLPETWTVTPCASSERELYSLMLMMGGSTCRVRPHEYRAGLRGVFDLLIRTERERADMLDKLQRIGLRLVTDEERRAIEAELLLPRQVPSDLPAPLSPVQRPPAPPPA